MDIKSKVFVEYLIKKKTKIIVNFTSSSEESDEKNPTAGNLLLTDFY